MAVYDLAHVSALQQETLVTDRLYAIIAMLFAAVSWLFAVISVVGFVNHALIRWWRELGLRCALGASTGSIVLMVVRQAARPVVVGLLVGVPIAWSLEARVSPLPNVGSVWLAVATGVGALCSSLALGILMPLRQVAHLNPSALLKR